MKTVTVDGIEIVTFQQRGLGDGGAVIRYLVDEGDGTYSAIGEWYSDPDLAAKVMAEPDDEHLRWVVEEARRQTHPMVERAEQKERPVPIAAKEEIKGDAIDSDRILSK